MIRGFVLLLVGAAFRQKDYLGNRTHQL
ncbi:hypothetical protein ACFW04_014462 [Cataglyphis niger]